MGWKLSRSLCALHFDLGFIAYLRIQRGMVRPRVLVSFTRAVSLVSLVYDGVDRKEAIYRPCNMFIASEALRLGKPSALSPLNADSLRAHRFLPMVHRRQGLVVL